MFFRNCVGNVSITLAAFSCQVVSSDRLAYFIVKAANKVRTVNMLLHQLFEVGDNYPLHVLLGADVEGRGGLLGHLKPIIVQGKAVFLAPEIPDRKRRAGCENEIAQALLGALWDIGKDLEWFFLVIQILPLQINNAGLFIG